MKCSKEKEESDSVTQFKVFQKEIETREIRQQKKAHCLLLYQFIYSRNLIAELRNCGIAEFKAGATTSSAVRNALELVILCK